MKNNYNPDVLNCLANLSNDEVFTPTTIVNGMLDLLPKEIWNDKSVKFLDPCTKTGVFLREIVKRLNEGLKEQIPDEQERINHILKNQVYGIAITELTGLVSRRSIYCSKHANGKYSACEEFATEDGNIRFNPMKHTWSFENCIYCGASKSMYDRPEELESHAYEFIHTRKADEILNMKFDVIIGNPPYQLNVGVEQKSYAIAIYDKFINQAKKMNPRYLTMIIPSRWFSGGRGLDEFRDEMLHDRRLRKIHDFLDASDCFPGVEVKGGVCYFLWDRDNQGDCEITTHLHDEIVDSMERPLLEEGSDIFIRYNKAIPLIKKILSFKEKSFSELVSPQTPFGLYSSFKEFSNTKYSENDIKIYANKVNGWLPETYKIEKNKHLIDCWKLYVPKAVGSGDSHTDWLKPLIGEPHSLCTQTYLVIGPLKSQKEAENIYSYTQTKFFHFLLTTRKITQDAMAKVYGFIPMQDFSESWNDEKLYKKYNLTEEDIAFIESMVRPEIGVDNE